MDSHCVASYRKDRNTKFQMQNVTFSCNMQYVYSDNRYCSSVGPVANATDVLQPGWLIVLTLSPPPV